ncbi:MAG: thioredoxin family protein [Chryseolinea sp.]
MKTLLISIVLFSATGNWLTSFDTARQIATKDSKYILLNFSGSDWCAPCIKMKKEVFESEAFNKLADERLVLLRADFPRSKKNALPADLVKSNEALAEKYNPEGKFPFTLLLDSSGKVVKTWDGYVFASQDKVIDELQHAVVIP